MSTRISNRPAHVSSRDRDGCRRCGLPAGHDRPFQPERRRDDLESDGSSFHLFNPGDISGRIDCCGRFGRTGLLVRGRRRHTELGQTDAYVILGSAMIDANGTTLIGAGDGALYAIDSQGRERWRYQTGTNISGSPVPRANGTILVSSYDGYLYAIGTPEGFFDRATRCPCAVGTLVRDSPAGDSLVEVRAGLRYVGA